MNCVAFVIGFNGFRLRFGYNRKKSIVRRITPNVVEPKAFEQESSDVFSCVVAMPSRVRAVIVTWLGWTGRGLGISSCRVFVNKITFRDANGSATNTNVCVCVCVRKTRVFIIRRLIGMC